MPIRVAIHTHTHTHTHQVGQHRIRKIANFKKAYGGKTAFEWCLEQHKNDRKLFLT
jgi:phage-related protein